MSSQPVHLIEQSIPLISEEIPENREIFSNQKISGDNEFLFFIKPEITQQYKTFEFKTILELIFTKIREAGLHISNIRILNAKYLEHHKIIAQHYGVINKISVDPVKNISEEGTRQFRRIYNQDLSQSYVLGSIEFMNRFPFFEPTGLDYLWQNGPVNKLAGGTYIQKLSLDSEEVFIINGFHPRQLEHFTKTGRTIITCTLRGDTDWSKARNDLIGKTNPVDANKGSIRRELLDNKDKLGLQAINSSWNGVHLSAGPVESLIELIRYNSDFITDSKCKPSDFKLGQKLIDQFGEKKTDYILSNPDLTINSSQISVFDYTEEKNSKEIIGLLSDYI